MLTAEMSRHATAPSGNRFADVPLVWWAVLALAVIAVRALALDGASLPGTIGDTDDAARLLEVRELMAGASWFNPQTFKMGGDAGLLTHWSRWIDLPIAMLMSVFTPVAGRDGAELIARAAWPLIVLAPLLWVLVRSMIVADGRRAAAIALALAVLCPGALDQFAPGRIDHHNVMIAGSIAAALLLWSRPFDVTAAAIAGAVGGFSIAIGYEALAPIAVIAGFPVVLALRERDRARAVSAMAIGFAAAFAFGFLSTIPPSRWFDIRCDAVSLNMVVLVLFGASGTAMVFGPLSRLPVITRATFLILLGSAGIAAYGLLDERCLSGPLGQLPSALWPVWLDHVAETRGLIFNVPDDRKAKSLALVLYFALAIAAQAINLRRQPVSQNVYLLAIVIALSALACWQFKYVSYASWIAIVPLALFVSHLKAAPSFSQLTTTLSGIMFVNQSTLILLAQFAGGLLWTAGPNTGTAVADPADCKRPSTLAALNALPPGLVSVYLDAGPFIALSTHHRVLAGPYHRIGDAIVANHDILAARDPADAQRILARERVDYVMTCAGLDQPAASRPDWAGTLRANLVAGRPPHFLQALPLPGEPSPYKVWKVVRHSTVLSPRP